MTSFDVEYDPTQLALTCHPHSTMMATKLKQCKTQWSCLKKPRPIPRSNFFSVMYFLSISHFLVCLLSFFFRTFSSSVTSELFFHQVVHKIWIKCLFLDSWAPAFLYFNTVQYCVISYSLLKSFSKAHHSQIGASKCFKRPQDIIIIVFTNKEGK